MLSTHLYQKIGLIEIEFLEKEFLDRPKLCFCVLLKYVFPNIHHRYTRQEIKPYQNLISCLIYRWCMLGKTYFNKIQKHNFGRSKNSFSRNSISNKPIQSQINQRTNELRALHQNCYVVHLENLMLAMLRDEDKTVRAKAVNVIQKIRSGKEGNQGGERNPVREFCLPWCNLEQHHTLI